MLKLKIRNFSSLLLFNLSLQIGFIISLNFINTELYGKLAKLLVFENIMLIFRFGILNDLNQIIPTVRNSLNIQRYFSSVFIYLLVSLPLLLLLLLYNAEFDIIVVAVIRIVVNYMKPFFDIVFRKNNLYSKYFLLFLLFSFVNILTVMFPIYFNFKGFLFRMILIDITYLVFSYSMIKSDLLLLLDIALLKKMFRSGFPLFVNNYLSTTFLSLPLIICAYHMPDGLYSKISLAFAGSSATMMLGGLYFQSRQNELITEVQKFEHSSNLVLFKFLNRIVFFNVLCGIIIFLFSEYLKAFHVVLKSIFDNGIFFIGSVLFLSIDLYGNFFVIIGKKVFLIGVTLLKYLVFILIWNLSNYAGYNVLSSVTIGMFSVSILFYIFIKSYVRFRPQTL